MSDTKNRPGRPAVGPTIQIRLSEPMLSVIDQVAKERKVSRSKAIRQLLASHPTLLRAGMIRSFIDQA